jgi:hypothetical protein
MPLGNSKQGTEIGNKLCEDSNITNLKKWRKNTVVNINAKERTEVDKSVYYGSTGIKMEM